jgi:pimeloyl-ACP methyl ester carboxylesterase
MMADRTDGAVMGYGRRRAIQGHAMPGPKIGTKIDVNGQVVHFHLAGDGAGPVLVLLHGFGSLGEEILPAFATRVAGYQVLSLDRPGYGFSDPLPAGSEGADRQADWLAAVLSALGLGPVILIAHSLAAGPALWFASRYPERLTGVLLLSPFCRPTPHAALPLLRAAITPVIGGFLRELVAPLAAHLVGPGMLERAIRPNKVPEYLSEFPFAHAAQPNAIRSMAAELLAFNEAMGQAEGLLRESRAPVAVVHGALDTIAEPAWHLPWLAGLMPDARVDVIDSVGHAPHHACPDVVGAAVRRFAEAA